MGRKRKSVAALASKICSTCDETDLVQFHHNRSRPDGFDQLCKACRRDRTYANKTAARDALALWLFINSAWTRFDDSKLAGQGEQWASEHGYPYFRGVRPITDAKQNVLPTLET